MNELLIQYFTSQNHQHYTDLLQRFQSGNLVIKVDEPNWREDWYKNPYVNRSFPIVASVLFACPTANNFHVYYDPQQDFHHIEFDLNNRHYNVRWYKIAVVECEGEQRYCSRDHWISEQVKKLDKR